MSSSSKDRARIAAVQFASPSPIKADLEQMFLLIEGILPFEACLYYQVVPLSIEGSSLNLGMVNPGDSSASEYVRRLVSYINCSIVPQQIESNWHREVLSKFLSHNAKNRQPAPTLTPPVANPSAEQPTLVVGSPTEIFDTPPKPATRSETAASPAPKEEPAEADSGAAEPLRQEPVRVEAEASAEVSEPVVQSPDPTPIAPEVAARPAAAAEARPTTEEAAVDAEPSSLQPPIASSEAALSLTADSPKALMDSLLSQVIDQGIGRLYLERHERECRILWSKDGVVQAVLEAVPDQMFQGVINELKLMMGLSLIAVHSPKQAEIERSYQKTHVLIRLRIMPGENGEEATLQILRGAALVFYQQQQLDSISRDALGIAHSLHRRIDELRTCVKHNGPSQEAHQNTLPAIMNLVQQVERELQAMMDDEALVARDVPHVNLVDQ